MIHPLFRSSRAARLAQQAWARSLGTEDQRGPTRARLDLEHLEPRSLRASFTPFPIASPGADPVAIVAGPDNAMWFTESNSARIGRIATSGAITEFALPTSDARPQGITLGPDNALWFTNTSDTWFPIGRITTAGVVTGYALPSFDPDPREIVAGPDGALWFTESRVGKIGRITTAGVATEYALSQGNVNPRGLTVGNDGALWFTQVDTSSIGRISTAGVITEYALPGGRSKPEDITAGGDGKLWITDEQSRSIFRMNADSSFTEFAVPGGNVKPLQITAGPDGCLWFTIENKKQIGKIATDGTGTLVNIPSGSNDHFGIAPGPDGNLWLTDNTNGVIRRVNLGTTLDVVGTDFSATEGEFFLKTLATFQSPSGMATDFSATIDWGDGESYSALITPTMTPGRYLVVSGHAYQNPGVYSILVTVSDRRTVLVEAAVTVTATVGDAALSATGVNFVTTEGQVFHGVVARVTDANSAGLAESLAATIDWGDGTASAGTVSLTSPGRFEVRGTHAYSTFGSHGVTVTVNSTGGASAVAHATAAVAPGALQATVQNVSATEVSAWSGIVSRFTDDNPLVNPSGYSVTIDWGDGSSSAGVVMFDGGPNVYAVQAGHTYAHYGSYTVQVTVTRAPGTSASATGTAIVSDAPLIVTPSPVFATEATAWSGTLASFLDPAGIASEFTATIDWGDGATSPGVVGFDAAAGRFLVNGGHVYSRYGSYPVTVTVVSAGGSSGTGTASATVADATPVVVSPPVSATEGESWSGVLVALTDPGPAGTSLDFSANIAWGDGVTTPGLVSFDAGLGTYVVGADHAYSRFGSYPLTVTVTTIGGASATSVGMASVADAPLSVVGLTLDTIEGQRFSGPIATFTDANPFGDASEFLATIDWGDGTTSLGTVTANGSGWYDVTDTHAYRSLGSFPVVVTVNSAGGASAFSSRNADVSDAPLTSTVVDFSVTEGASWSGLVATFTDANPFGDASEFVAIVVWGDGSTGPGVVTFDAGSGQYLVHASHSYARSGVYPLTVVVDSQGGASSSATGSADVADATLSVTAAPFASIEGASWSGLLATFTDANPFGDASEFLATIDWGDGSSSFGSVSFDPGTGSYLVSASHSHDRFGSYTVSVRVTSSGGSETSATTTATIADAMILASGVSIGATEGASWTGVVATFTDANPFGDASEFLATIDWGDGTTSGGVVSADGSGGYQVTSGTTYGLFGSYPVSITIVSVGGASATVQGSATATDPPVNVIGGRNLLVATNQPFVGELLVTFSDPGLPRPASDYAATIDWGDGTTSPGLVRFDPLAGRYEVLGNHSYGVAGAFVVNVAVAHGQAPDGLGSSTVLVDTKALVVNDGESITPGEGRTTGSWILATFTDPNGALPAAEYLATVDWGDGNTSPAVVTFDPLSGRFEARGDHVYNDPGVFLAQVRVNHPIRPPAMGSARADVANAPVTAQGGHLSARQGEAWSGVIATFLDADPGASASDYLATIQWGDGSSNAGLITFDGFTNQFLIRSGHVYLAGGSQVIKVEILDATGLRATTIGQADVDWEPATLQGAGLPALREGQGYSGPVAVIVGGEPGAGVLPGTVLIDWGDGVVIPGRVVCDVGLGVWVVEGSHAFAKEGVYTVRVTAIASSGGGPLGSDASVDVSEATVVGSPVAIQTVQASRFEGVIARFLDPNPFAGVEDYHASVDWGDGNTDEGFLRVDPATGAFEVLSDHVFAEEGVRPLTVVLRGQDGREVALAHSTATVTNALAVAVESILAVQGQPWVGVVATFTDAEPDAIASNYLAMIEWGDGQRAAGLIRRLPSGRFEVESSHTFGPGVRTPLKITVTEVGVSDVSATGIVALAPSGPSAPELLLDQDNGGPAFFLASRPPTAINGSNLLFVPPQATQLGPGGPASGLESDGTSPALAGRGPVTRMAPPAPVSVGESLSGSEPSAPPAAPEGDSSNSSEGENSAPRDTPAEAASSATSPPDALASTESAASGGSTAVGTGGGAPTGGLSRGVLQGSDPNRAEERFAVDGMLLSQLELFEEGFSKSSLPLAIQAVVSTGMVASAGYLLLQSRAGLWALSLLTSRPLWKGFDPLEVIFAWEREQEESEKRRRGSGRGPTRSRRSRTGRRGSVEPAGEESLQSIIEEGAAS